MCFQNLCKINQVCMHYYNTFNFKDLYFFINFFELYIRLILDYNVSVWIPHQIGDIINIESALVIFTRLVCRKLNIKHINYRIVILSFLNFDTLEIRRIYYDLILIFRIILNLIDLKFDGFCFISSTYHLVH